MMIAPDMFSNAVMCPRKECGCDNLHQGRIDIYNRAEDKREGQHVRVTCDSLSNDVPTKTRVIVDEDLTGNPSGRRQGLSIQFLCEQCDRIFILDIVQHKGTTYMGWRDVRGAINQRAPKADLS